jgi:hypothetical protein
VAARGSPRRMPTVHQKSGFCLGRAGWIQRLPPVGRRSCRSASVISCRPPSTPCFVRKEASTPPNSRIRSQPDASRPVAQQPDRRQRPQVPRIAATRACWISTDAPIPTTRQDRHHGRRQPGTDLRSEVLALATTATACLHDRLEGDRVQPTSTCRSGSPGAGSRMPFERALLKHFATQ